MKLLFDFQWFTPCFLAATLFSPFHRLINIIGFVLLDDDLPDVDGVLNGTFPVCVFVDYSGKYFIQMVAIGVANVVLKNFRSSICLNTILHVG